MTDYSSLVMSVILTEDEAETSVGTRSTDGHNVFTDSSETPPTSTCAPVTSAGRVPVLVSSTSDSSFQPTYFVPKQFYILKEKGESKGNWIFSCQRCVNKNISASYKSRQNLRAHIKSRLIGALKSFDEICNKNDKRKQKWSSSDASSADPNAGSETLPSNPINVQLKASRISSGLNRSKLSQKDFDLAVSQYIAESVLPFHHVESAGFKNFMKVMAPDLKVKSRKVYSAKADHLFESHKKKLTEDLMFAHRVCLTIDHWSAFRRGFIGITAHWYTDNLVRKNACIALRRIEGRCTFNVLGKLIESVLAEYNIARKVTHCVTDSGSNFIKAFAEFGSENEEEIICNITDTGTSDELTAETIQDIFDDNVQTGEDEYSLPSHFRCATHRLSLIATKDASAAMSDTRYKSIYRSLTGKLSAIWNKQSSSVLCSDKISAALGKLFVIPNMTRWNSTFDGMTRVHEFLQRQKQAMSNLFISLDIRPINAAEQKFLEEFLTVMRPIAIALDILQGTECVSAGFLLPTLTNVQEEWKCALNANLIYCTNLVDHMKKGLSKSLKRSLYHPTSRLQQHSTHNFDLIGFQTLKE